MKKITLVSILGILGVFMFAMPALAATTASLLPTSVSVIAGQKFNVAISVNPQGTANFVEKLEINYPADILEVTSFTLGGTWMAMTTTGYDSTDNANGVLIKTAGYPSGLSSSAVFGTVSFTAKKAGSGIIKIGNGSLAFQASGQSAITGSGTSFVVTAPIVPVVPTPKPEVKTPTPKPTPTPAGVTTTSTTTETAATTTEAAPLAAAVALSPIDNILTLGTGSAAVASIVTLVVLLIIGGGIWLLRRR